MEKCGHTSFFWWMVAFRLAADRGIRRRRPLDRLRGRGRNPRRPDEGCDRRRRRRADRERSAQMGSACAGSPMRWELARPRSISISKAALGPSFARFEPQYWAQFRDRSAAPRGRSGRDRRTRRRSLHTSRRPNCPSAAAPSSSHSIASRLRGPCEARSKRTSYPRWRRPVSAARAVCGNHPVASISSSNFAPWSREAIQSRAASMALKRSSVRFRLAPPCSPDKPGRFPSRQKPP